MDGYTFIFDIDGTICPIKSPNEKYEDVIPYDDMVRKIRDYKQAGAKIVLFTSRNMNTYQGNIGLINKYTARIISEWLDKWNIPYDEIIYGKPWPGHKGFYVDDRAIRPNEFLTCNPKELEMLQERAQGDMNIIITMAGAGSRFRSAGYNCPKYMIEVKEKTLFEWAMESLSGYRKRVNKYIFVVQASDDSEDFIREKCIEMDIGEIEIVQLDGMTDGQATSCYIATEFCESARPILIYNIDTYVEPGWMRYEEIHGDGYIPCFSAEGNHWSFVIVDESGRAKEIREKERISDNCTIGAYYFASAELYKKVYEEYYGETSSLDITEKYIAPMYNYMINNGYSIFTSIVPSERVHVLGTPEELKIFAAI